MARVDPIELKGAMIQRIATFIEWPNCPKNSISFVVYDDSHYLDKYKKVFASQMVGNKEVVVKHIKSSIELDSLNSCDIVCLGDVSQSERLKILDKLAKKGILIIGSSREDVRSGVPIALIEDSNRYRILINPEGLRNSNLKADYRLLKLSEIVEGR